MNNPWIATNDAQKQWVAKWNHEVDICKSCIKNMKCTVADRQNLSVCQNLHERINGMNRPYENWSENELRNGIWHLANGMSIPGGYTDIELLRQELRLRGLTDEGYHNT